MQLMKSAETNELSTNRFAIRAVNVGNLGDLWPHVSDPDICRDMSWDPHVNLDETLVFLKRLEADWHSGRGYTWTITHKESQEFCGIFSLIAVTRQHRALTYNRAELAYWCAKAWQNRGVMSEVGKRIIDYAYSDLNINRLVVSHHVGNVASERLIKRLGFRLIGCEHQAFRKGAHWIDTMLYEMLCLDFQLLYSAQDKSGERDQEIAPPKINPVLDDRIATE